MKLPIGHNISIEHFRLMTILTPVKSLRILLTLLLVALWPLVTSHCSLEHMPGLEFLAGAVGGAGLQPNPSNITSGMAKTICRARMRVGINQFSASDTLSASMR